jgi:diguanylate cyclase (GGDEF)-like protein/PAS domain S-box-containing protein
VTSTACGAIAATSAASPNDPPEAAPPAHPRTLGWIGTTALAMGGSNQSLFILGALFVGQGDILGQGSAAIPLLLIGLLLAWAAAPGWIELVLMYPHRVGGIAATCTEAFRPYSPVLANLTGVCYWWGWVPTCGLTAILAASAINQWYLPDVPVTVLAIGIVVTFTVVNLLGIKWVTRLAVPVASASALLAFVSGLAPALAGQVDWKMALSFELTTPFSGWFGQLTSLMAGLYLIGFAAPAFEAAACHVGETVNPNQAIPRAMFASALLAGVYFAILPLIWLGTLGPAALGQDLALVLGPTFAPLFGNLGKAAAIWFMVFSMFSGTLQPLAGAARALSQLSEDGLLPRALARRSRTDAPWVATVLTAAMAILFLLVGDPIWLVAAANFTYLISIALPSLAVWLLRRDAPLQHRPYRAPRGTITLGLAAAIIWGLAALLGFEQFGLSTVLIGLAFAYSGSALYAWRRYDDRRRAGLPGIGSSLQIKLTGAMLLVLVLDGTGYLLAVGNLPAQQSALMTTLADIFVAVAMLSISVALVLPGMIAHSVLEVSSAARRLATGTLADFSRAMNALGRGDLDAAHARVDITPVQISTHDEVGDMAASFNILQVEIGSAAVGLGGAREGLRQARGDLTDANARLEERVSELHRAEEKLSSVLDSIDNVVWSFSLTDDVLLYLNPAAERVYGRAVRDFFADPALWLQVVHPEDRLRVRAFRRELLATEATSLEYRIVRPDGSECWLEDKARVKIGPDGSPVRIDGVASDISERRSHAQRMAFQANHDALTGLPNRNLLNDRVAQAMSQAARTGQHVAVLFLDLDGFKFINDSFGHSFGDAVLRTVAARLQVVVRASDTIARLGGDEFVILLPGIEHAQRAVQVAAKVLEAFKVPITQDGRDLHLSGSIGISVFPEDGDSCDRLLQNADVAMYRAKADGRNRFQGYSQEMGARAQQRMALESALRVALERDQLELYYQPQVDRDSGLIVGVEALLRWNHPERGMVSPADFIPLAEETGLIVPLGEWVLKTACAQAREWHDAGSTTMTMAVNMSARQFQQQDVPALVADVLRGTGLPARFLELELTESAMMRDTDAAIATMRQLKALGVRLALDDFGTGYSSLSYLKRFPIDVLKIDRSFTMDVTGGDDGASITRAIVAMARSLNMTTVAEGVETREQLDILRALGCDVMQGYYFSRPLPAGRITEMLRDGLRVAGHASVPLPAPRTGAAEPAALDEAVD